MTVYELIGNLSKFPPNTEVFIIPQKRKKWNMRDRQRPVYTFARGFKPLSSDEPSIEICGVPEE